MLVFTDNDDIDKASSEDLARFEDEIGFQLPKDYREFLRVIGGGKPSRDWVSFGEGGDGDYISFFHGLNAATPYKALRSEFETFGSPQASGYLAIAMSIGGNYFLLQLNGEEPGSIHFWDHDEQDFENVTFDDLWQVSDSFSQFTVNLSIHQTKGEQDAPSNGG